MESSHQALWRFAPLFCYQKWRYKITNLDLLTQVAACQGHYKYTDHFEQHFYTLICYFAAFQLQFLKICYKGIVTVAMIQRMSASICFSRSLFWSSIARNKIWEKQCDQIKVAAVKKQYKIAAIS